MTPPAFSPAADRNKEPILATLQAVLPAQGHALELASGTGQHAVWFEAALPGWTWQPTDARPEALGSIAAYTAHSGLTRVRPPLLLDVMAAEWLPTHWRFDLIYCANMLHVAPWPACAALMAGSARHLAPGGVLVTYGPYLEQGMDTSPGNLSFDASLRAENPAWGLRQREDVEAQAEQAGLRLVQRHAMPANNLLLVWAAR
jgi:SAM-dependent methyltransferase